MSLNYFNNLLICLTNGKKFAVKRPQAPITGLSKASLCAVFLAWIVVDGLSFKLIKFFLFHKFLSLASPIINEILFRSDDIMYHNFYYIINLCRLDIVRALINIRSKIYLIVNV